MRAAAPRPTIPATFSEPERRPRSWPPPWIIGARLRQSTAVAHQGAGTARTADLVAANRHQSGAQRPHVEGQATRHLSGVTMEQRPRGPDPLVDLAHRVEHARLAVGRHHRHEHHVRPQQLLDGVGLDEPAGGHADHVQLHPGRSRPASAPFGPLRRAPPPTPASCADPRGQPPPRPSGPSCWPQWRPQ